MAYDKLSMQEILNAGMPKQDFMSSLSGFGNQTSLPDWRPKVPSAQPFQVGAPAGLSGMDWFKDKFSNMGLFDTTDEATGIKTQGMGGLALGAMQGLGNGFLAMQNYGLARDSFNESKDQFNRNFAATQKTANSALEDRQRARVASNPGAYQSIGEYMKQNGV